LVQRSLFCTAPATAPQHRRAMRRLDRLDVFATGESRLVKVPSRQAVTGHNVRYVLVFGLRGAMLALGIAYVAMFH
jgi:hypothetical protein